MNEKTKQEIIDGLNAYLDERFPWCKEQNYTGTNIHHIIRAVERGTGIWPSQDLNRYMYDFMINKGDVMRQYIKDVGPPSLRSPESVLVSGRAWIAKSNTRAGEILKALRCLSCKMTLTGTSPFLRATIRKRT